MDIFIIKNKRPNNDVLVLEGNYKGVSFNL